MTIAERLSKFALLGAVLSTTGCPRASNQPALRRFPLRKSFMMYWPNVCVDVK